MSRRADRSSRRLVAWVSAALATVAIAGAGLVVTEVEKASPSARAGFVVGDELLRWQRGEGAGRFESARDFDRVGTEEIPRGPVEVTIGRAGAERRLTVAAGFHGLKIRPRLAGAADARLAQAVASKDAAVLGELARARLTSDPEAALWMLVERAIRVPAEAAAWESALAAAGNDRARSTWVQLQRGQALLTADPASARNALEAALTVVHQEAPDSLSEAFVWRTLGTALYYLGDLDGAEAAQRGALALRQSMAPQSLDLAGSFTAMLAIAKARGDLPAAAEWSRQALDLRGKLAPGSALFAGTLMNAGVVAHDLGDLDAAESDYRQALTILEAVVPESPDIGGLATNLGVLAQARGDLDGAAEWHAKALEVAQRTGQSPLELAVVYESLGVVAFERRDLVTSESWHRKVLEIRERFAPGSLGVAATLNNLAIIALARGELDTAFNWEVRALEINEAHAPGSPEVGDNLHNLAAIFLEAENFDLAEEWELEALALYLQRAPQSLAVARTWSSLAGIELRRGGNESAARLFEESIATLEPIAPNGLDMAILASSLGAALTRAGHPKPALGPAERSVRIRRCLAPDSSLEAEALWNLAGALDSAGRTWDAIERLQEARQALERQQLRLGGSPETLAVFRNKFLPLYRLLIERLVDLGCTGDAIEAFESARARALLALLAERDLVAADVPPELERERAFANSEAERVIDAVGKVESEAQVPALMDELRAVRDRQAKIRQQVLAASPRLAALRYPQPLSAGAVQSLLPEGTLALAFVLGYERSTLLAISRDAITVHRLDAGGDAIQKAVANLRKAIERPNTRKETRDQLAGDLSRQLFGPASERIAAAARLLIFPDGALWMLPFAALPNPMQPERLLIEDHRLVVAPSATVVAELVRERRPRSPYLVAFGDPVYPETEVELPKGPVQLRPLPGSRREVEAIARLYGSDATVHLGADASEAVVRALGAGGGRQPSTIHLAAHAVVDESRPLESSVALSAPGVGTDSSKNGLLEASELFEGLRFDCDLVVLSACETALGREEAGEGILGLTRGFQYAGARSVVASLWPVADESTGVLMQRFHANLRAGQSKDEALRQAQLSLVRAPIEVTRDGETQSIDVSNPFHWAGFELFGDWQ